MIIPLQEGTYTVDDSKIFLPFDLGKDRLTDRSRGSLLVEVVPFLIQTKNETIIIDPGLGIPEQNGSYRILKNLEAHGIQAEDITMVLLSHLHKDHAGGICRNEKGLPELMFLKAKYYCQQKEMEYAFSKKNSLSYEFEKLSFLQQSASLNYLDGDGELSNEISFEVSGGHTPYHQVFLIHAEEETCFFGGDVLPQPSQLQRKFIAKYDYDGKLSAQRRQEYAHRAAQHHWLCLFFHATALPMAFVKEVNGRFEIEAI